MRRARLRNPLSRFRLAVVLLGVIILYGIAGYMLIDGWNLLDAFYMVIITISTVGYTEIHPQSAAGRIFTSTLIVVGVALDTMKQLETQLIMRQYRGFIR
jgi:voltage-gated potassium channel